MHLFLASNISDVAKAIFEKAKPFTKNKHLVFIPTAAEPEVGDKSWEDNDRNALRDAGYEVSEFTITRKNEDDVRAALKEAGSICVGGGNTYYLMNQIRLSGFEKAIKECLGLGAVYVGSSAGSIVAGPDIETNLDDRILPEMTDFSGMKLTDVSVRPHWTSTHFEERYKEEIPLLYQKKNKIILLNNKQYLRVDDESYQIVDTSVT
ncbi:Type 1 glutamine amidotransferase-like domain-containing protein [soil metagenome]